MVSPMATVVWQPAVQPSAPPGADSDGGGQTVEEARVDEEIPQENFQPP
jgi:hypothetical protein